MARQRKGGSFYEQQRVPYIGETVWLLDHLAGKATQGTVTMVSNIDNRGLSNTYIHVSTPQGGLHSNIASVFDHKPRRQTRTDEFGEFKAWI